MYPRVKGRSSWSGEEVDDSSYSRKARERLRVKSGSPWNRDTQIEDNFYSKKTRERLVEEEALTDEEAGFMQGYEDWFEEGPAEDWKERY